MGDPGSGSLVEPRPQSGPAVARAYMRAPRWRERMPPPWLIALVAAPILLAIGFLVPFQPLYAAAGAAALLALGLTIRYSEAIPVISMATLLVIERVGGESLNLSASDAVLLAAFGIALFLAPRPFSPPLRAMLWLTFVYQVASLFTVIANPFRANTIEWFHAWLLTGGALVVGWAVGRAGRASLGLGLVAAAGAGIAALSIGTAVLSLVTTGSPGSGYLSFPWGMHKNFVGCVLGFVAVLGFARPSWLPWRRGVFAALFWLCTAGILASQSRQALVALGVAVVMLSLRREEGRRINWAVLASVPLAMIFVASMVQDQLESGNEFNSAFTRLTWYEQAIEVWLMNPWFGMGLRWWVAGRTQYGFQPPNAELEVLSSVGVVGLLGFLVMMLGPVVVLWRIDSRYSTVAIAMILSRFIQGQFDLFWVSVQVSVPFVLVGVMLGDLARRERQDSDAPALDPLDGGRVPRALTDGASTR